MWVRCRKQRKNTSELFSKAWESFKGLRGGQINKPHLYLATLPCSLGERLNLSNLSTSIKVKIAFVTPSGFKDLLCSVHPRRFVSIAFVSLYPNQSLQETNQKYKCIFQTPCESPITYVAYARVDGREFRYWKYTLPNKKVTKRK